MKSNIVHLLLMKIYYYFTIFTNILYHTPIVQVLISLVLTHKFITDFRRPQADGRLSFQTGLFSCGQSHRSLRDLLLIQRITAVSAQDGHRRWTRMVCVAPAVRDDFETADVLSVTTLCPSSAHVSLAWSLDEARDFLHRFSPLAERAATVARLEARIPDQAELLRQSIADLLLASRTGAMLRAPHVSMVKARDFLKSLGPEIWPVAVSLPPLVDESREQTQPTGLEWLRALAAVQHAVPQVRFIVVGTCSPEIMTASPPVGLAFTFFRSIGKSLLDEAALIAQCDAYVGPFDIHAVVAADAGVPMLIVDDETGLADLPASAEMEAQGANRPMLILPVSVDGTVLRDQLIAWASKYVSMAVVAPSLHR